MNNEYIKELYISNKNIFNENGINSEEELKDQLKSYITSNIQYDFDIDLDIDKLFNAEELELEMTENIEIEK